MKGFFQIWLIVGALIIIIAGGAYYLGRSNTPKPVSNPMVTYQTSLTPQATVSASPDETAKLKTYTNDTYKFSFKYPIAWDMIPSVPQDSPPDVEEVAQLKFNYGPHNSTEQSNGFSLIVYSNPGNKSLSDWYAYHNSLYTKPRPSYLSSRLAASATKIGNSLEVAPAFIMSGSGTYIRGLSYVYLYLPAYNVTFSPNFDITSTFKFTQ